MSRINRPQRRRKLRYEALEERDLLALYLPDSFAADDAQPAAIAFNGGEQVFFTGQSGDLQFGFGQSALASQYGGAGWTQLPANTLGFGPPGDAVWRPVLLDVPGEGLQAIYRDPYGGLSVVDANSWLTAGLETYNVLSNPSATILQGELRINYVASNHHVWAASPDPSYHGLWEYEDLNALAGVDASADAVSDPGATAFQLGGLDYTVYQRSDGDLGLFTRDAAGNTAYSILNGSVLPSYQPPMNDSSGELSAASYDSSGQGGAADVGWIFYRDATSTLRAVWLYSGQPWRTATFGGPDMRGVPSATYDPAAKKVSVASFDANNHLLLRQEGVGGWSEIDYHGGGLQTIPLGHPPLPDAPPHVPASGTITLPTGTTFSLSVIAGTDPDGGRGRFANLRLISPADKVQAQGTLNLPNSGVTIQVAAFEYRSLAGAAGNTVDIVFTSGPGPTAASYDGNTQTVTVQVNNAGTATLGQICTAINNLEKVSATPSAASALYNSADNQTFHYPLSGGQDGTLSIEYDQFFVGINVSTPVGTTGAQIAALVDTLPEYAVTNVVDTANTTTVADTILGPQFNILHGFADQVRGAAIRPNLYWKANADATALPGLHIVYKDAANHIQNFRVAGQGAMPELANGVSPILDSTAYLEGYRADFGYGVVNAARAVAYALGSPTALSGGSAAAWNLNLIGAPAAWTAATGANTAIFALDSGFDAANLDLQTLAGISTSSNASLSDQHAHGTAIAGVIGAANDSSGVTGVAYDADVVPIKVGDAFVESEPAIVDGIDAAMNYALPGGYADTRIVNLSFGYSFDTPYRQLVLTSVRETLNDYRNAAVFVAAAGNRSKSLPDFPAGFSSGTGIVAGAIDMAGLRSSPSHTAGSAVSAVNYLLAPGVDVPVAARVGSSGNDHNTTTASGSGIAAAHISGVAALILQANPTLTPHEVESILLASADPVTASANATGPVYPLSIYWA